MLIRQHQEIPICQRLSSPTQSALDCVIAPAYSPLECRVRCTSVCPWVCPFVFDLESTFRHLTFVVIYNSATCAIAIPSYLGPLERALTVKAGHSLHILMRRHGEAVAGACGGGRSARSRQLVLCRYGRDCLDIGRRGDNLSNFKIYFAFFGH